MLRFQRAPYVFALAVACGVAACSDPLSVSNTNNPDRTSVLRLPRDVEALASNLYKTSHNATLNSTTAIYPALLTMSFENASSLNNSAMGPRSGLPRSIIDNSPGNSFIAENSRDFQIGQNGSRAATTIFERIAQPGFTLGTSPGDDARLRAFTWFGYGITLGNVALAYDSAAIPRPGDGLKTPPLVGYDSVMRAALAALDSAQAIASSSSPAITAIPSGWMAQAANITPARFVRIIRSYKARFRADVARTPAERAAVDWNAVAADASNGLDADLILQLNPTSGWDYNFLTYMYNTGAANWHQMPYYIIGMADSSGAYDAWLATPRDGRSAFLIRTRDARFPAGNDRATQIANSPAVPKDSLLYFRNRATGEDQPGAPWAVSQYDHNRWRVLFNASRVGPWPTFSKAESDMLAAEAYIRTGNVAAATALIDITRTKNKLPKLTGVVTATGQAVPGGTSCVPRVPDAAQGYTATKCGDVLEAMKWEKRMESAYASYATWFFDARGWGDLPEGTPIQYPTPTGERDTRGQPSISLGGVGRVGGAAKSVTYGFGSGNQ